jgi:hypothetical protein
MKKCTGITAVACVVPVYTTYVAKLLCLLAGEPSHEEDFSLTV